MKLLSVLTSSPAAASMGGVRSTLGAALGGVLLTLLTLVLFYQLDGIALIVSPIVLKGADLRLANGQGLQTSRGLEITQSDQNGVLAVQGSAKSVRAALYRHLRWRVEGLQPDQELRLIWATRAQPLIVREKPLSSAVLSQGALNLGDEPYWEDRIVMVGLALRGKLTQPLVIESLALQPVKPGMARLGRLAIDEWSNVEDWNQRSINYRADSPRDALFPPVLLMAMWLSLSFGCYALWVAPNRLHTEKFGIVLFLLAWLVLDVHWQWGLSERLALTKSRFAGKEGDARSLADLDGELYRFVREMRTRLPVPPARIFIVSTDPGGYWAVRTRYHLLPHNSFMSFAQPPASSLARAGDYVLLLLPWSGVQYHQQRQFLESANGNLPVESLYSGTFGTLFRVRKG